MKLSSKRGDECVLHGNPQHQSTENNNDNTDANARPDGGNEDAEMREILLISLIEAFRKFWAYLKLAFTYLMVELGGYNLMDNVIQWSVRNPHLTIFIVAGMLIVLVPFLLVLGIGLSTLLMTLMGFMVLEGILISVLAAMLIGCVGFLFLTAFFVKKLNRST